MTENSLDQCRADLAAALVTAANSWVDYPLVLEMENRIVDLKSGDDPSTPHVSVEFKFNAAWQADMSSNPIHRHAGFYIVTVKVRKGQGTSKVLQVLEHLYSALQNRKIGGTTLEFASVISGKEVGNWYGSSAMLPFRIDKVR